MEKIYDLIIIGAGPAGLSASVYASRAGLDFVVLDKNYIAGGQIINTYEIENYLGLDLLSGMELATKFSEHATRLGMTLLPKEVLNIEDKGDYKLIVTDDGDLCTKNVIIAAGASHRELNINGEVKLRGRGVSYCATCDGAFFREKTAVVIGGGDVAVEDAIFLARICKEVYLVHRRHELRATKVLQDELFSLKNVTPVWDSVVEEIEGEDLVTAVRVKNRSTGEERELSTNACFVAVGIRPSTELLDGLVRRNEAGYVETDEVGRTAAEGIFVAGDARKKRLRQIVTAVADGAVAATAADDYLTENHLR